MTAMLGTLLALMFGALSAGLWVGITLIFTSIAVLMIFKDLPVDRLLPQYIFNIMTAPELVALPLFILMGEILFRTRLSRSLFNGLAPWAELLPGRLLHVNVIGCSIFAAISGSSAATTQVIGRISLSELLRRGYSPRIAIGSLAGAGTLGFLIPPSTVMIIYGVLSDTSVLRLFTAGILPSIVLVALFMGWIMIFTGLVPGSLPPSDESFRGMSLGSRIEALRELLPAFFLILSVLGSMYGGLATPSEAAAVGVIAALAIAGFQKELNFGVLREILMGAMQTCSMIGLIVLGASILGNVSTVLGVPGLVSQLVAGLALTPMELIGALLILYLVLGCFLDGFSMIVMTLPVVLPMITNAGFDPVWFGVFLVVVVEMAQLTPPVGFNLFVIQGLTEYSLLEIATFTLPFLIILAAFVFLLAVMPELVLFLPNLLLG